ncbi:MAG: transporter related [Actinomycetia bacterium]|nr:transporter related [Actinomycetes bacterium]
MSTFLSLCVTGAVSGAIYSLLAAGLTLSYSASGIFNFAQGAVAFVVAFLFYELNTGLHWSVWVAALVSIFIFAPLLGLILDFLIFRPLMNANETARILAPVGLLIALPAIALWIVEGGISTFKWAIPGGDNIFLPPGIGPTPAHHYQLASGVNIDSNQVIVFVVAAAVSVGLWILMRHTSLGLNIRATVDSRDLASLRGVNPARSSAVAWAVGICLAGLVGVVGAPVFNSLSPVTYTLIMFAAATAAVAGRLRSIPIAFAGGLLLGIIQNLVAGYADFARNIPGFSASIPALLLLVLLVILGRDRVRVAGSVNVDVASKDYLSDLPLWRRALPWAVAVALLLVYVFAIGDSFWIGQITQGLAFGLIFLSFVVVTGLGGMVSLAQAAFVTLAGLTAGVLISNGWPFWPALLVGALAATVAGVVVALPALRVSGLSLALATLALGLVGDRVLFSWQTLSGVQNAGWRIPRPPLGFIDLTDNRWFILFLLALIGVTCLLIRNLERSASGRAILTVRSSDVAAATTGISSAKTKLALFAISAAIAGVGGVLLASYSGGANGNANPTTAGLIWLASVVLFGVRRPAGAVLAGLVAALMPAILSNGIHLAFLPNFLSWNGTQTTYLPQILFGIGAIQMARYPDGAISITSAQNFARRQKRREQRTVTVLGETMTTSLASGGSAPTMAIVHERLPEPDTSAASAASATSAKHGADIALAIEGVRAGYHEVEVLHGVDLTVEKGSLLSLLGANGAGKSTLCKVLSGQLTPSTGTVWMGDQQITAMPPHIRARRGFKLAPESRGIFPALSVEENLALVLKDAADRAAAYDRFPVLYQRRSAHAGNLSGGEQQMLTLAPLLVRPPSILVADEPTLGLAPLVIEELVTLFQELTQRGVAILLVEERARDVVQIADRVAILTRGEITWSGSARDVNADALTDAYLGGRA